MNGARRCAIVMLLFMLSSSSAALEMPVDRVEVESLTATGPAWTAEEAAEHWIQSEPTEMVRTPVAATTGWIHTIIGSFDPVAEPAPVQGVPAALLDDHDVDRTGVLVVQLESRDSTSFLQLALDLELAILDTIPDDSWIVRLPEVDRSAIISNLISSDEVRWIGSQHPAWRLHTSLHPLVDSASSDRIDIDLTLAPDIDEPERMMTMLAGLGAEEVRCDPWLCQVRSISPSALSEIASEGMVLFTEPARPLVLENAYGRQILRVDEVVNSHNSNLDGNGQVGAISDTGLDSDHGDFTGRIRSIYNQYGPDNSASDMNSGHGTHVAASMVGDGSGASSQKGAAPAATFHFYQLEHDSSGSLARWGSLYDMFRHSWQQNARLQSNSWGAENAGGDYSSDSRSADSFASDYQDFLVLFAAGNEGSQGASSIAPPSTAKNVLAIGASTTGRPGTGPSGAIASFSSIGPTDDGRIKPDLVAPGVQICSARAEEARYPAGPSCSSSRHPDGTTPLYMSADGTSAATPLAAGTTLLARQFLSDELGVSSPRSDLLRAIMINRAKDLGTKDIPNNQEGWGQMDLANSIYPRDGVLALNTFFDWNQTLNPGYAYVYTYDLDASHGLDVTVVWNDREGSATASQTAKRLVNDLDLEVTSPDGTVYKGNVFSNGLSTAGGSADDLNVIERVRLEAGPVGNWSIAVRHSGGSQQSYAIVITSIGNENPSSDLAVFPGSLWTSMDAPLEGDQVALTAAWVNQAPATTPAYVVTLEDETTGDMIWNGTRSPLAGGAADSFATQWTFDQTGIHTLKLTLDANDDVVELNDGGSITDNNVLRYDVNVTAIGVRLTAHSADGSIPTTTEGRSAAQHRILDPSTGNGLTFDLTLANEGTATSNVDLVVTPVQIIREDGILDNPGDEWQQSLSEDGPWALAPGGGSGDSVQVTLDLLDTSADLTDSSRPRYALPGTHVIDLTLYDRQQPLVAHSIRLTIEVLRIEGLFTQLAGDVGLAARPGDGATFTLSVLNTGNGPTAYSVSCETPNRWSVEIGNGNSSSVVMEPMVRLQGLPIPIRVNVPPAIAGQPAAGVTEDITCVTNSVADANLTTTEQVTVTVLRSERFVADMYDEYGTPIGPGALAVNRAVLNGQIANTTMRLENEGNVPITLNLTANSAQTSWNIQFLHGSISGVTQFSLTLGAGVSEDVMLQMVVPPQAEMRAENEVTVRVSLPGVETISNKTKFIVEERASFTLGGPESGVISCPLGETGIAELTVHNGGNTELVLEWKVGTLPEGWQAGFLSNLPPDLEMNEEDSVDLGVILPAGIQAGMLADGVPVIVTGRTPNGDELVQTIELAVQVPGSAWPVLESNSSRITDIPRAGEPLVETLRLRNDGNAPLAVELEFEAPAGWTVTLNPSSVSVLAAGMEREVEISILAGEDAESGIQTMTIRATPSAGVGINLVNSSLEIEVAAAGQGGNGGLNDAFEALGVPAWATGLAAFGVLVMLGIGLLLMRNKGIETIAPGESLVPAGSNLVLGAVDDRRHSALDIGEAESGGASGMVSDAEIAAALAASAPPPLIPPGLPPGLPPGASAPTPQGLPPGLPPDSHGNQR